MQSIVSRRKILIASLGAAAVGLTRTAQAAPANVPSIWDGMRLFTRIKPLLNDVDVIFYPISFMNIHSEPQGTTILMSKDPAKTFEEQHEHFKDPDFRGIRYDVSKLPEDLRNKVWTNTKLHRRSGCRAVPYGVFKNSKGEYVPFDENLTTEELKKVFELN